LVKVENPRTNRRAVLIDIRRAILYKLAVENILIAITTGVSNRGIWYVSMYMSEKEDGLECIR
jgi:hypothetical protein